MLKDLLQRKYNKIFYLIGILVIIFVFLSSLSNADLTTNLISSHDFNENTNDSTGDHDGTWASPTYVSGLLKNASSYSGGNEFLIPHSTDFNFSCGDFSFNIWLKASPQDAVPFGKQNAGCSGNPSKFGYAVQMEDSAPNDGCRLDLCDGDSNYVSMLVKGCDDNNWNMLTIIFNSSQNLIAGYLNTEINNTVDTSSLDMCALDTTQAIMLGERVDGFGDLTGLLDQFSIWDRKLLFSEIESLYNNGTGLPYPFVVGEEEDSTPPVISTPFQQPSNLTFISVTIQNFLNISSNITDNVALNLSKVLLDTQYNLTYIYINGSLHEHNGTINYTIQIGDRFDWILDEHNFLSATYNINADIMETVQHFNFTLSGLNNWLKMEFLNVSNIVKQVFIEQMYENASDPVASQYYYCNSSYSTGNPIASSNCVQFFEGFNNIAYNHSHQGGISKHKILPMGIDTVTGKIDSVYVTPISYILKRGSVGGDLVFYINNYARVGAYQTSNNNGNTWTEQTYSIDAHIHQIGEGESVNYRICANDTSDNQACTRWFGDVIDFLTLPPNAVQILNPVAGSYEHNITINHTASFSASGQTITGYQISYKETSSNDWIIIVENNFPDLTLFWDILSITNGDYHVQVVVSDNLGLNTSTVSAIFGINNPIPLATQALLDINDSISELGEGLNMLWVVALIVLFLVLAFAFRAYIFISFSGAMMVLLFLNLGARAVEESGEGFYVAGLYIFLFMGIAFLILGILLTIIQIIATQNEKSKTVFTDFYPKY